MYSIQLIRLLDVLKVNTVRNARGINPRSIIISGQDFTNVESVLINGTVSPAFMVLSSTQIIAEVPSLYQDAIITDVAVLATQVTFTQKTLVTFTFGTRPKKVSGTQRLMQTFLRLLLRSPGSNVFHRRSGGGLVTGVGKTNIGSKTAADVAVAINTTKQYLIGVQTAERNIPPSERLLSAEIAGINADPANTSLAVTIVLTSHAGQRTAATMMT
jgi:hypothetical protein